jgi:tRNA A37 threonylcarbamoyladenosine synthetase subunit TsaC/SUA5/YrdC
MLLSFVSPLNNGLFALTASEGEKQKLAQFRDEEKMKRFSKEVQNILLERASRLLPQPTTLVTEEVIAVPPPPL